MWLFRTLKEEKAFRWLLGILLLICSVGQFRLLLAEGRSIESALGGTLFVNAFFLFFIAFIYPIIMIAVNMTLYGLLWVCCLGRTPHCLRL